MYSNYGNSVNISIDGQLTCKFIIQLATVNVAIFYYSNTRYAGCNSYCDSFLEVMDDIEDLK